MMDRQDIDQIALRLVSLVPPGLAQAQQDLRTNFQVSDCSLYVSTPGTGIVWAEVLQGEIGDFRTD